MLQELQDTIKGNALLIMNCCHSGAVAQETGWVDIRASSQASSAISISAADEKSVDLLAACEWNSTVASQGPGAFLPRLGKLIINLMCHDRDLPLAEIHGLLNLSTQVPYAPLRTLTWNHHVKLPNALGFRMR